jgi:hypothetical protein
VVVDVIAPVRTLAEKLALLNHAGRLAAESSPECLQGAGPHFFDIHQPLNAPEVVAALSVPGQTMDVLAADVDAKGAEFGWGCTPCPAGGYAASALFDPTGPVRAIALAAYELVLDLVWGPCRYDAAAIRDSLVKSVPVSRQSADRSVGVSGVAGVTVLPVAVSPDGRRLLAGAFGANTEIQCYLADVTAPASLWSC